MYYKNYGEGYTVFAEAFFDVGFIKLKEDNYEKLITIWQGDFGRIVEKIPLNEDGMYVALACHYQVDTPWEDCYDRDESWEVDELETSLSQLLYVKNILAEQADKTVDKNDNNQTLLQICTDMCDIFDKAIKQSGKVYIRYYY